MDKPTKKCIIDGCERPQRTRGWCTAHYSRWLRHGDVGGSELQSYSTPEEAFEARTEWCGECLVWTGYRNPDGYGRLSDGERTVLAHRFAWERVNGQVPPNMMLDHICRNRACVNLDHLRIASRSENGQNRQGPDSDNRSGVRNVTVARNGKYVVRIKKNGKTRHFGTYKTLEEATEVAERERKRLFGEFAGRS